ncbi:MAG: polysaccharide deacetylase family protein [Oscillospiraceae bacterium]|nr:polysaccharide deacetylase family protein [Oscillospiraceae bacterium]
MYKCFKFNLGIKILLSLIILFACVAYISSGSGFSDADVIKDSPSKPDEKFLPVLMYHSICDDTAKSPDYIITPAVFEDDLKYLKTNGYNSVLPQDLVNYIHDDKPLPDKMVMITFDDGFYNNLYYALPLLEQYNMKAVVSIVGSFCENQAPKDPGVPCYSYLTWENITELNKSGLIEIGNHTYNLHSSAVRKGCAKLPGETEDDYNTMLSSDLGKVQSLLTENCSITPVTFAYPFGHLCRESIPVLRSLGFQCALNCYEKPNYITKNPDCLFSLNRYNRSGHYSTEAYMKKALSEKK